MTKLKIIIIGLLITAIILGNFWYYMHSFVPENLVQNKTSTLSGKSSSNNTASTTKTTTTTQTQSSSSTSKSTTTPISNVSTTTPVTSTENTTQAPGADSTTLTKKKNIPKSTSSTTETSVPSSESSGEEAGGSSKPPDTATYATLQKILVDKSWNGNSSNYSHYWGNENVSFLGDALKIRYPKGSNAPSNTPRGGAGFVYNFPKSYDKLSLSYTIKFEEGFDFVKGGKLPGLCGGNCSRGESMSTASGFSMRFVWKKNGYLDIMTFFPNTVKAGNYSGEKMFKFEPGKEYLITQQLTLNDIGSSNGIITILVDGKPVYTKNDVTIRVASDVQITSFLFSTFFGGKDDTYSSSKDTFIYFGKFKISDTF